MWLKVRHETTKCFDYKFPQLNTHLANLLGAGGVNGHLSLNCPSRFPFNRREKILRSQHLESCHMMNTIPYSGKLLREKTCDFHGFVVIRESFLCKILGVASFGTTKVSNLRKFSPWKSYFNKFAKVSSLESFPLYSTWLEPPLHQEKSSTNKHVCSILSDCNIIATKKKQGVRKML